MCYPTRSAYWKDFRKVLGGELAVLGVALTFFISWLIIHLLISKWQNIKPQADSDHVAGGNNNLIPEESLQ